MTNSTATATVEVVYTRSMIQGLIDSNDKAAIRALSVVYANQTQQEKVVGVTVENNGVGFSGADAEILTSFAEWYKSKGFLSPRQMTILKKKIRKYWSQVLRSMAARGLQVNYNPTK